MNDDYTKFNKKYAEESISYRSEFLKEFEKYDKNKLAKNLPTNTNNNDQNTLKKDTLSELEREREHQKNLYLYKNHQNNLKKQGIPTHSSSQDYLNFVKTGLNSIQDGIQHKYEHYIQGYDKDFKNIKQGYEDMTEDDQKLYEQYKFRHKIQPKIFNKQSQEDLKLQMQDLYLRQKQKYLDALYTRDRDYEQKGKNHKKLNSEFGLSDPSIVGRTNLQYELKKPIVDSKPQVYNHSSIQGTNQVYDAEGVFINQNLQNHNASKHLSNREMIMKNKEFYDKFFDRKETLEEKQQRLKEEALKEQSQQLQRNMVFRQQCVKINKLNQSDLRFDDFYYKQKPIHPFNYSGIDNLKEEYEEQRKRIFDQHSKNKNVEKNFISQKYQTFQKDNSSFHVK